MKTLLENLGKNSLALACVISAAALALTGKDAWVWFLIAALFIAG